jgi:uncharacterized protein YggE
MKRQLFSAAALLATSVILSGCDSAPPVQTNARQVTVVGSGEVQGAPDTVTADVGIDVVAPEVSEAMSRTSERQKAVIDALTAQGIDPADIRTTAVDVGPQYGENSVVTGYRAGNSINVTIRAIDKAPRALSSIVAAGGDATRINAVNFTIDDDSALITEARARAFEDAKARAGQYAQLSGMSLGRVISISESPGNAPPPPAPAPKAMAADVPLQPGQQTVSFSVTAVWELT